MRGYRSKTVAPKGSRKKKGSSKKHDKRQQRKFKGTNIAEGQARELETLFDLCDQGKKNAISKASLLTILKALNLCFKLEDLNKTIEKVTMKDPEEVQKVDFSIYEKVLNDFIVVKHRERENRSVFETFSIFDRKGHIDIAQTNRVTTRIGNKLTESELKNFFEELNDDEENGKIPAIILYNYVLSK